jgi:nucleoside-diphosphate-sugar epimerase
MMIKKLLLIGAGYVGLALLKQLREFDVTVTTTDEKKVELLQEYASKVILLQDQNAFELKAAVEACDAIVILVAPKGGKSYAETYLHSAEKIYALVAQKSTPTYILYTGSTSVYEGIQEPWATEDLQLAPPSPNGIILLQTEQQLMKNTNTCILRLGGIFGPDRELEARAKRISGDGDVYTNHIHRDDIVEAIQYCLEHQLTGIYNLVNDDHPTRRELYNGICDRLGIPRPHWSGEIKSKPSGYRVSNQKIKSITTEPPRTLIKQQV